MPEPSDARRHKRPPTLAQVAMRAGVDRSVASRALNGDRKARMTPATRERIIAAAQELGYRPNAAARGLRTSIAGIVGLAIPDFANPVYAEIIKGAEQAANHGDRLLLTGSLGDERQVAAYLDRLVPGRIDGLLLAAGEIDSSVRLRLDSLDLPWLLVNRRGKDVSRTLTLDDANGARLGTEHLLELGHRRIALIRGPEWADTSHRRETGFRAAMLAAGIPVDERLVNSTDYSYEAGARAMLRLLHSNDPPTGVVVANIAPAVGALHAAGAVSGIEVPRDCSVVAIHDLPIAEHSFPPLTTVRMPLEELGRRAVELLWQTGQDETVDEICTQPMQLIIRRSTAPPRR